MKQVSQQSSLQLLRFDSGEDVFDKLKQFCQQKKISAGFFTGIGACQEVVLSYYHLSEKKYFDKHMTEDLEIVSLTGNLAIMDQSIIVHAHGSFSNADFQTFSGHVKKIIVSATCELHLTTTSKKVLREYNAQTGLNLLKD